MGDAGVLRGWEELGCSDPNMPPDVRGDGVFFDFFSEICAGRALQLRRLCHGGTTILPSMPIPTVPLRPMTH